MINLTKKQAESLLSMFDEDEVVSIQECSEGHSGPGIYAYYDELPEEGSFGRNVTSVMSPCQCKLSGGCLVNWVPKGLGLYADGTEPELYNKWGQYTGSQEVPTECRQGILE